MRLGHAIFHTKWPARTKICCWWCTEPFQTCPVAIPTKINHTKREVECYGVFCSHGCAKAYMLKDKGCLRDSMRHAQDLMWLHKELSGSGPEHTLTAPPRQTLKKFGGSLSIQDFRSGQYSKLRVTEFKCVPTKRTAEEHIAKDFVKKATYASEQQPVYNLHRPRNLKKRTSSCVTAFFKRV